MNFLDEDKSWELFCIEAFQGGGCPPELEVIGKKIVRECKGLPLSIVLIGGLLRNSTRTLEYWENFAGDINSPLMSGNDEHCLKVMNLSYNHLPAHLKPCFLYMGIYREDERIYAPSLIKTFVAEGFLKPNKVQRLEEVAEDYLKDLVDRNLILVEGRRWNGRIKYCRMHDLVRDVCLRIGEKADKFICAMRRKNDIPPGIDRERCIVQYGTIPKQETMPSALLCRTFGSDDSELPFKFRLLRVLILFKPESGREDVFRLVNGVDFGYKTLMFRVTKPLQSSFREDVFQSVNLRCLSFQSLHRIPEKFPSLLSLLWNLQTLDLRKTNEQIDLPFEIWYMRQLRHLHFLRAHLPDPPAMDQLDEDDYLLPNLLTLSGVVNFSFTEEVCRRIPNIRKLRIIYEDFSGKRCCCYIHHLHKLDSLTCVFERALEERSDFLQRVVFPSSLRNLYLNGCRRLDWDDVNTLGLALPHLEAFRLYFAAAGDKWDCVEGALPRLRFLEILSGHLKTWNADSSVFFPVLENLHLFHLRRLEEIPSGVGEIDTLGYLLVAYGSERAAMTSREILMEQQSLGNEHLKVEVKFSYKNEAERFREMVEDIQDLQPAFKVTSVLR